MTAPEPGATVLSRRALAFVRVTNVVLAAYLAYEATTDVLDFLDGAPAIRVLPRAFAGAILAVLVLVRPEPRAVRWDAVSIAAVLISNWHYLLYDVSVRASEPVVVAAGAVLVVAGLWAVASRLFLGTSFAMLPALRRVRTRGPYAVVRHPIYLSLIVADLALVVSHPSPRNAALAVLGCCAHVVRILREESLLSRDPAYVEYRRAVRFRLVPFVW